MARRRKHTIADQARERGITPEIIYHRMRTKGMSLEDALALGQARKDMKHHFPSLTCAKYPRLAEYMVANRLTFLDFAEECGVSYTTIITTVYGDSEPGMKTIRKILDATMMTFEEAFQEVDTCSF